MKRNMAVLGGVVAVTVLVASCSSSPHRGSSGTAQTGAGGPAALAAAPPAPTAANRVRLGFIAAAADAEALVGLYGQGFLADLGPAAALEPLRFESAAAETSALVGGRLDAAFIDPVSAVAAWQASRGKMRVISGAATRDGQAAVLLVVTAHFLSSRPYMVQGLLKGQVQAMEMLATRPTAASRMAVAELASLGVNEKARQFARRTAPYRFSCDPAETSVLAQARQAAAVGRLSSVASLAAFYDLTILNKLLSAAGLAQVR